MTKIAILGYGTVGSGVFEVINKNHKIIEEKTGDSIEIKKVLDIRDFPENDPVSKYITHDFNDIFRHTYERCSDET